MSTRLVFRIALGMTLVPFSLHAQEEKRNLQQLSMEELLNVKLTVASRTETTLLDAPAIVSVYTSEDMRRMGARDLRDVLRHVPGFEIGVRGQLGYPEIGVRGVMTDNTEKVRILIDGVAVNENLEGSGTIVFGDLTLDNVQQIEIIRGPGSALYGTNAFVAVVSIITKDASGSGASSTLSAHGGSFNTREGSLLSGWSGPTLRVSGFLHYLSTDGPRSKVDQDALQLFSIPPYFSNLNSGISLAGTPEGYTREARRKLTAQLKATYQGLTFNGLFINTHKEPFFGPYFAITKHSDGHPEQAQGSLSYLAHVGDTWVIEPRIYMLQYRADNRWNSAPDGYRDPGATYTQGRYDINRATQSTKGAEVKTTWDAPGSQKIILGAGYEEQRVYRLADFTNLPGTSLDGLIRTPPILQQTPVRSIATGYLQDQWSPLASFGLTAGLRWDRYNDAGTSLTPRLALIARPESNLTFKVMYGEAFRAPTFVESYLAFSNFVFGRENNKPETIQTLEGEGAYRFGDWGLWRVGLFRNRISNLIRLLPYGGHLEYQNIPDATVVKGVETEWKVTVSEVWSGYVNYSAQSGRNEVTKDVLVGMANWRASAGINAALTDQLNLNASWLEVGQRQRDKGDPRPELKGYHVVDLALIFALGWGVELNLTAHNLFDADQRYPNVSIPLPGDYPAGGRDIQAGFRWRF